MTSATCRHTNHIPAGTLDACTRCDRVRVSTRDVSVSRPSRWYVPGPDEAAMVADVRAHLAAALARRDAGRPVLPPGQRRDVELRVRLRPGELDALDALAARWRVSRSVAVREAIGRTAAQ